MTYSEKLQDPRWQKKRLEILQRENFTCQDCGAKDRTLHVHHRYYVSGRHPWEYPHFCYQVLCFECHDHLKVLVAERRENGEDMSENWEDGLDYFGEKIYDMMMEEAVGRDYDKAHANNPKP